MPSWRSRFAKAGLETLIIVAGILLALAADGWRESYQDRREGEEYVERMVLDLQADTARLRRAASSLAAKREILSRLLLLPEDGRGVEYQQMAEDLAAASNWSFVFAEANATTFEEMKSSGRLGLIRDTETRAAVQQYYRDFENTVATVAARRTPFGSLSYSLVLRKTPEDSTTLRNSAGTEPVASPGSDFLAAPSAGKDLASELVAEDLTSIRRAARAELNYAQYALVRAETMRAGADGLLERLQRLRVR